MAPNKMLRDIWDRGVEEWICFRGTMKTNVLWHDVGSANLRSGQDDMENGSSEARQECHLLRTIVPVICRWCLTVKDSCHTVDDHPTVQFQPG